MTTPKVSLAMWGVGPSWTYEASRAVAQEAERLGFDSVLHQDNVTAHTPYPRTSEIMSPWIMLPALAEATSTIRIGTLATPALRRYAPLLAKDATTLDRISDGRLTIGLGTGDDVVQYESLGQPFPARRQRVAILRESIETMKLLWSGEEVSYEGSHIRLDGARMSPTPVQTPNPPIWIVGNTSKTWLPHLAADIADGYCILWGEDEAVERGLTTFRERWAANGRPLEDMVAARCFHLLVAPPGVDVDREFERLTGGKMDWSVYASTATVPVGSDPEGVVRGEPDEVADEVRRRSIDMGFNHVVVYFHAFGMELETDGLPGWAGNCLGTMRLFADRIWPRVAR